MLAFVILISGEAGGEAISVTCDGRFAPSPSGPLHLGNLRTALVAWLWARANGGRFLVRVENLDLARSSRQHEAAQLRDLSRIGVDWDGEPLRQSDRLGVYRAALENLQAAGRVYPCWCTRAEVRQAASAPHGDHPEGAYPGTCRVLSRRASAERERSGRPAALRLDAGERRLAFVDRVHGPVEEVVDDFVLWRADDTPAYNLAVVVDDAEQGVGEVVRGDDLLAGTPRQLLLYELLGRAPPAHAHVPLVLGADGRRLSKRHGSVTLDERLGRGEPVSAVVGWMAASLGLVPVPVPGPLRAEELIAGFDLRRLSGAPTVFEAARPLQTAGPQS